MPAEACFAALLYISFSMYSVVTAALGSGLYSLLYKRLLSYMYNVLVFVAFASKLHLTLGVKVLTELVFYSGASLLRRQSFGLSQNISSPSNVCFNERRLPFAFVSNKPISIHLLTCVRKDVVICNRFQISTLCV